MSARTTLTITMREARLIFERLAQAAGAPPGLLIAAREAAVAAALATPDGFGRMPDWMAALGASRPLPLDVSEAGGVVTVECGGQHAFYCAEALLDLAVDADRRGGGIVLARGVGADSALAALPVLAERHGYAARLVPESGGLRIALAPREPGALSIIDRFRIEGRDTPAPLWWRLYEGALEALAPDSFESRRHAGTVRVEADGRLVGRNDEDETDLSMLTAEPAAIRAPAGSTIQG